MIEPERRGVPGENDGNHVLDEIPAHVRTGWGMPAMKERSAVSGRWVRMLMEGVLIVASILLAFAIDAWWDARQERAGLNDHLAALAEDVAEAKADALASQTGRERRTAVIHNLLGVITESRAAPSPDTLNAWLGQLWGARSPMLPYAALEDLRASGVLASIESQELRRALFNYSRIAEQVRELEARVIDTWQDGLQPYLVANTDALPQLRPRRNLDLEEYEPVFPSDVEKLLSDRTFQNLLLARLRRTVSAYVDSQEAIALLERIGTLLELEAR